MNPEEVVNLTNYLALSAYPKGYTKQQKGSMRRKAKHFELRGTELYRIRRSVKSPYKFAKVISTAEDKQNIFQQYHSNGESQHGQRGHFQFDKTFHSIAEMYYWPSMSNDIRDWVAGCAGCQKPQRKQLHTDTELQPVEVVKMADGMNIRFDGKRALVTGAGKGIGRGIVLGLVACGAETVALSRTQADLDSLKRECPNVEIVQCDLSDWNAMQETLRSLGAFDLLVCNAAIAKLDSFGDIPEEHIDISLNTNVKATINVAQEVGRVMVENKKGGSIVFLSSQASQVALKSQLVYSATKGAVDAAMRVMALELGRHQIRVNCVNPTVIMTEMAQLCWSDPKKSKPMLSRIPLGRFGEVVDVVHPVLYLLSDYAKMINGVTLPVDGGVLAS